MNMAFKVIGGLLAVGLIWIFQLVLAMGLFVGYIFALQFLAAPLGVDVDNKTIENVGIGAAIVLTIATIFWLERRSRRYGLDFLFTWLPF